MEFECFHPDIKKLQVTQCSSADFVEVETENMREFDFLLKIESGNYSFGFESMKIVTHYQNNRYYAFTLFFKLMFLFMVMMGLIAFYFKITQLPFELWLQV